MQDWDIENESYCDDVDDMYKKNVAKRMKNKIKQYENHYYYRCPWEFW